MTRPNWVCPYSPRPRRSPWLTGSSGEAVQHFVRGSAPDRDDALRRVGPGSAHGAAGTYADAGEHRAYRRRRQFAVGDHPPRHAHPHALMIPSFQVPCCV